MPDRTDQTAAKLASENRVLQEELKDMRELCQRQAQELARLREKHPGLSSRMSAKKPVSYFPWILGCFVLFIAIIGASVIYDITIAGSYSKSYTSKVTGNSLEYARVGSFKFLTASARGYKWAETNVPPYFVSAVEFGKPYWDIARDLTLVSVQHCKQLVNNIWEYAVDTWPVIYSTIDGYAPGYLGIISEYIVSAWNAVTGFIVYYVKLFVDYLMSSIFVDNWAPNVIREKTLQAFNATQIYAADYYRWFYKYVDDYSKL